MTLGGPRGTPFSALALPPSPFPLSPSLLLESRAYSLLFVLTCAILITSSHSSGQAPPVTISAIVAIQKFCSALQDSHADAAAPFISKLFEVLTNLAVQTVKAKGSPDVLIIILDTLMQISPVHPATTLANESKILPLANACFINFTDQPFVVDAVQDLISELAGIPQLSAAVHARLLPTLVDIVQKHEDPKLLGLVERSVELLKCIAEAIPDGTSDDSSMTRPLCVSLTRGHCAGAPTALSKEIGATHQRPFGSVESYLIYADVRLYIPMTRANNRPTFPGRIDEPCLSCHCKNDDAIHRCRGVAERV